MTQAPVDTDYIVAKVKGTPAQNVAFWIFLGVGVVIVMGLGRISRILGLMGFGAYLLFTVVTGLSAVVSIVIGLVDLFGVLGRSKRETTKLWGARVVKLVEFVGLCLLTLVLYRHFF